MKATLLFLSYFGPDHTAAGMRVGRLTEALAAQHQPVAVVHSGPVSSSYEWHSGIRARSFPRADPSAWRERQRARLAAAGGRAALPGRSRLARPLRRFARSLLQPDEMILSARRFVRAATAECLRLQERGGRVVVIASGPPWSTLLVGRRVASRCNVPYVIDFQDLWSSNPVAQQTAPTKLIARWLEQRCASSASASVFVNQAVASCTLRQHADLRRQPSAVAAIGFRGPVPPVMRVHAARGLSIGHFGSLYRDRSFGALLEACEALAAGGHQVVIHWYGEMQDESPDRARMLRAIGSGCLVMHGIVSHDQAVKEMRACDVLLTVPSPSYPEELTTKFYDYLDAGRPILALAEPGALLSRLVSEAGIGRALAPADLNGLRGFLQECLTPGLEFQPDLAALTAHSLETSARSIVQLTAGLADHF